MKRKIKVLFVDNSTIFQKSINKYLGNDYSIEIVGNASDAFEARDLIVLKKPDVMALEIELPRLNGLDFLKKLMPQHPIPVVILTDSNNKEKSETLSALNSGAVDFVKKPKLLNEENLRSFFIKLKTKLMIASTAKVAHWKKEKKSESIYYQLQTFSNTDYIPGSIIVIGASTGGTEATKKVITKLSPKMPGILVVQHMPKAFTRMYAENLNRLCYMTVKEAEEGDVVRQGNIYVAPGDYHMTIDRQYTLHLNQDPQVHNQRPAIDVTMFSAAKNIGRRAYGMVLTGMGKDGAAGLLAMKKKGSKTMTQDEETSVVYSMPKVAWENGASDIQLPIESIANYLVQLLKKDKKK